jgi:hypothetical protein
MDPDFRLNERARAWIRGLKSCFETEESSRAEAENRARVAPGAFKIL